MKKLLLLCLIAPAVALGQLSHQEKKEKHLFLMKLLANSKQQHPYSKSSKLYLDSIRYKSFDGAGNIDYSDLEYFGYHKTFNQPMLRKYVGQSLEMTLSHHLDMNGRDTLGVEILNDYSYGVIYIDSMFKTYDTHGNIIEENNFMYDEGVTLLSHERISYNYENGLLMNDSTFRSSGGSNLQLNNWNQHEYSNGKLIRSYHYYGDQKEALDKTEFDYHSSGFVSQNISYDLINGTWVPEYGYVAEFDGQNRLSIISNFDSWNTGVYEMEDRYEFTYDQEGKLLKYEGYEPVNGNLVKSFRGFVADSKTANYEDLIFYSDGTYYPKESSPHQLIKVLFQEPSGNNWVTVGSLEHYWSGTATNLGEQPKRNRLLIFPNPAQDQLSIESSADINELRIYTLQGKQVQQLTITPQKATSIAIGNLKAGTYILSLQSGDQQQKRIFIKE